MTSDFGIDEMVEELEKEQNKVSNYGKHEPQFYRGDP